MERDERDMDTSIGFFGRWVLNFLFFFLVIPLTIYTHTLLGGRDMGIPRVLLRLLLSLDRKCHII
jgi:hypothetical protein